MKFHHWLLGICVLLLSGLASSANVLIVHDGTAGIEADVVSNLSAKLVAHSDTVTTNVGVPGGSLAGYRQVWDVRFNNTTPLTSGDQTAYLTYLQGGGSLFLMGENTGFITRDNSIGDFIALAGGGSGLSFVTPANLQTVQTPFTGPNAISTITYQAAAGMSNLGRGYAITKDAANIAAAVGWGPGSLTNAAAGALIVVLDVNFLQAGADANMQSFTANLIAFLASPTPTPITSPTAIPTLSEWGMIILSSLLALGTFVIMRRKQS